MDSAILSRWIIETLLLGLRIAPIFAYAPPFSLVRIPGVARMLLGVGLAACLVSSGLPGTDFVEIAPGSLVVAAVRELLVGMSFVLAFQIAFGALQIAGRTIDIQAGFGLALLIDPSSKAQVPLVGTLFVYAAGAIFFAMGGHYELLRLIAASLEAVPLGTATMPETLVRVTSFLSISMMIAMSVASGAILTLFLADTAIAFMSRTVPQMNVLLLGFQVKTILLLVVLAGSFGMVGALLARLMATTLAAAAGFIAHG